MRLTIKTTLALTALIIVTNTPSIFAAQEEKPVIYQLFVRTFSATGTSRAEVGTFNGITDTALYELRKLGTNIIWLTGIMEHASPLTDDPDVVKGTAGSPYAIRDYYDVQAEYGTREDFAKLVNRIHARGMKVVIDLVANHTARNNIVDVPGKNNMAFGIADNPSKFFSLENNFFYIKPDSVFVPPPRFGSLRLGVAYDGIFDRDIRTPGIQYEYPAKVSGNDVMVPNPDYNSWFETVKLNYGFDFRHGGGHYYPRDPLAVSFDHLPNTWHKMIDVINYWLDIGVDGFRCDIANMVPISFWKAAIYYARQRHPDAFFLMEAYETPNDPIEYSHQKMFAAGADAIYAQPVYDAAKAVYQSGESASSIGTQVDQLLSKVDDTSKAGFVFYTENHDQVRAASRFFRSTKPSPEYSFILNKFLFGLPGQFMIYNGQEVGEPGSEEDGRTTIFDYAVMPAFAGWVNNGLFNGNGLTYAQKDLRQRYADLFGAARMPAIAALHSRSNPSYANLSPINRYNYKMEQFISTYARFKGDDRYVVVANFDTNSSTDVAIHFTSDWQDITGTLRAFGIRNTNSECWRFRDIFTGYTPVDPNSSSPGTLTGAELWRPYGIPSGLYVGNIPPMTVYYFKVERCN